jgi:RNA polymerase sigma factor (sigma-70 family)
VTPSEESQAAELMKKAQVGDESAYADLLLLLTAASSRYARRRLGTVGWVDDVVQETLITVHRARHTYDGARPFAPWFYAILSTRLIDVLRRERRVASREFGRDDLPDVADPGVAHAHHDRSHIDVDLVRAAVRALPARQREVVHALKYRGDTVRAASTRLGMTEAAVKITAHRGYNALRRWLGGHDRAH